MHAPKVARKTCAKTSVRHGLTPTDPCVLMVGLLAQPERGLVRPDDVAELHFWSSWRLLANALSPWVIGREHESNNKNMVQILRGRQHQTTETTRKTLRDSLRRTTGKRKEKSFEARNGTKRTMTTESVCRARTALRMQPLRCAKPRQHRRAALQAAPLFLHRQMLILHLLWATEL